ncbi:hypothetical protein LTR56_025470 [Elasticomyces elasticus]|nr:hypothetical protein LTR56_025470 [Elasticomyces elasticus]KAK3627186.1 hypothetical protein LTR22_022868 [Elasticomyces elasticus]
MSSKTPLLGPSDLSMIDGSVTVSLPQVTACAESIVKTYGNKIALEVPTTDVVVGSQILMLGAVSTIDGETLNLLPGRSQLVTV